MNTPKLRCCLEGKIRDYEARRAGFFRVDLKTLVAVRLEDGRIGHRDERNIDARADFGNAS